MTSCKNFSVSRAVIDTLADVRDELAMNMSVEPLCIVFAVGLGYGMIIGEFVGTVTGVATGISVEMLATDNANE